MRKRRTKLVLLIFFILALNKIILCSIFADGNSGVLLDKPPQDKHYQKISDESLNANTKLDLWHYSGGYWKVTNPGSEAIKIYDDVMGAGDKLVIPSQKANFTLTLPAAVQIKIKEGKKVVPFIQSGTGVSIEELFDKDTKTFSMTSTTMTFSAKPKFNLIPTKDVSLRNTYGLNIPITVPFIESKYGYNMYSVFGNGYKAVQVNGWVDRYNKMSTANLPAGWIHPTMIADTSGTIRAADSSGKKNQLMINSKLMDAAGFTIGQGTFSNAGALGLCFEYPVKFTFYVYNEDYIPEPEPEPEPEPDPEIPPQPQKIICQKCGQCEIKRAGVCTADSCVRFGTEECGCYVPPDVQAEAVLALPNRTYETHPVTAIDNSRFTVDGTAFSASRAYAEKYATNSFRIVQSDSGGKISRTDGTKTQAEVVFPKKGSYDVELKVKPKGGGSLTDVKPIEVLKTPTIVAALTGTQKQNRKQVLNIRVATSADGPLESLYVEIIDKESGEKVHLVHRLGKGENKLENCPLIRTRPIIAEPSDRYWTNCRLEFLTKNTVNSNFAYKIYARDSRGLWDEVYVEFPVAQDRPPEAKIEVAPSFLRGAGSNTAAILAEDATKTDGDQLQRKWSVANAEGYDGVSDRYLSPAAIDPFGKSVFADMKTAAGYQDNSFGTGKSVQFNRTGVGKVRLKLEVKDVWTEETLPEYITEADYLTASALAETEVVNVAPIVSLEPVKPKTADILMLAGGEEEYEKLKESVSELNEKLRQNAVDAEIAVEKMTPNPSGSITYRVTGQASANYGFQGTWSGFWENGSWALDNHRLFKAEATWNNALGVEAYPELPYTIKAYDTGEDSHGGDLAELWSLTVTEDMLRVQDKGSSAYLAQDNDERFLYFCAGGKTLVVDKQNGALLSTLSWQIGKTNSVSGSKIYSYKQDGIYRINMSDGSVKKLHQNRISAENMRRIGGKDHFLVISGTEVNRGIFDPRTEKLELERLNGTDGDSGVTTYRLAGVDTEGKLIVSCVTPTGGSRDRAGLKIRAYDRGNSLLKTVSSTIDRPDLDYVVPIYNAEGVCRYMGLTWQSKGSRKYSTAAKLWGIYDNYDQMAAADNSDGYPSEAGQILMGIEHGDGNCYIVTGGQWSFIENDGYNSEKHGLPQRAKGFRFSVKNSGGAGVTPNLGGGVWTGLSDTSEYASRSDSGIAVSTGDNNQYEGANHTTKIVQWAQSIDEILRRCMNRTVSGRKDTGAVVVYDNRSGLKADSPTKLAESLREKNAAFLCAGAAAEGGYGAQLAEAAGARGKITSMDLLTDAVTELLLQKEENGAKVLQMKSNAADGRIEKTYQMTPGMQYFYEYDYKELSAGERGAEDILRVEAQLENAVSQEDLLPESYRVTDCFEEDFNDAELCDYFTLAQSRVTNGVYYMANRTDSVGKGSNSWYTDSSSLKFTVPEGKQAVLSFDYDIKMDNNQDWMMQFCVDGIPWKNFVDKDQKGFYTHPELLKAGEHTLSAKCGEYGSRTLNVWCRLDNLRIAFVEPSHSETQETVETSASVTAGQGWNHAAGSFRLPNSAVAYQAAPAKWVSGTINQVPMAKWISEEEGSKAIRIELPGKAAFVGIKTNSRPVRENKREYGSRYSWNKNTWTSYENNDDRQDEAKNVPKNYLIPLKNVEGTLDISQNSSTYRGARGTFDGVEILVPEKMNPLIENGHWFLGGESEGERRLFLETSRFGGQTTVSFQPGAAGDYQLKNLRIYTIQNGTKVYTEDSTLGESGAASRWNAVNAQLAAAAGEGAPEEEEQKLVYKKGELVSYRIGYYDYENDPSKKQYWKYTHTPFNDGAHPQAAVILDENGAVQSMPGHVLNASIDRFFIDGKYTVEHWQEDNTRRGKEAQGNPDYDKASNTASLTFYIEGGGTAPWITAIRTAPGSVREGDSWKLQIGVDDVEKDPLRLTTEVYKEGKLIFTHRQENITADSITKKYPNVVTGLIPEKAQAGRYEVVCTVRDWSGTGLGTYKFTVVSEGKITGAVTHTEEWERNRRQYNVQRFGTEYNAASVYTNYVKEKAPRKRGTNVFWSGEQFKLRAAVSGKPESVTCTIAGYGYSARMKNTGKKNEAGETIYEGQLWDSGMMHKWGRPDPEELTFRFTADYGSDKKKTYDVKVIVDAFDEYWQLHRFS